MQGERLRLKNTFFWSSQWVILWITCWEILKKKNYVNRQDANLTSKSQNRSFDKLEMVLFKNWFYGWK